MPYLICNKCDIYYEILNISEIKDFNKCECGNILKFYENIEDYINEEIDSSIADGEESQGIFYSINRKKLVNLEMYMLKDQKEKEEIERSIRDLRYRIRHVIAENKEKFKDDSPESEDENLKKKKERLLKELEQLKKSQQ
ncbi:MAG: hypothetical protein ACXVHT_03965 [Methanobacterium sp.]